MKNSIKSTLRLFYFCFLFLAIGTLVSCKSKSVPLPEVTEVNTITKKEIVRDTVFLTKKDSSYYSAWLECVNGKVQIKGKPVSTPGKHLNPPKVEIKDNQLKVDCTAEAQRLFAQWKDTYTTNHKQTTLTKTVYVEKQLTWWQKFRIFCGSLFLIIGLSKLVLFLIKFFKPI